MWNTKGLLVQFTAGFIIIGALCLMGSGGIQSAYNLIESGGSPITKRTTVNFTGTGISCSDSGGISVCNVDGAATGNYSQSFSAQTTVVLAHNLGTTAVLTQCTDGSGNVITPASITITDSNDVTVTFSVAQTGTCVVNGAAAGSASSVPFSGITSGDNTGMAGTCDTGCSMGPAGTGVIDANQANGAVVPASATAVATNAGRQFVSQTAVVLTAFLNVFTDTLQGLVPASGGGTAKFLRADHTFAVPPTGGLSACTVVTGSRSLAMVFQNTGTTPLFVMVTVDSANTSQNGLLTDSSNPPTTKVAAVENDSAVAGAFLELTGYVFAGNFYEVTNTNSSTLEVWTECQ